MELDPTIAQLVTVGGNAAITSLLCELFWRTAALAPATKDRFGPIVAVLFGVGLAITATLVVSLAALTSAVVFQAILTGFVGGLAAIGVHDVARTRAGAGG